ncbi:Protein of unknown function [Gryllus bimaculatus]|nr:Protein of unknown function [Gryllus bimaculatus]
MEKMENQDRRGFRVNFDALCLGDDLDVSEEHSSTEDRFFDSVIGHIEDVLLGTGKNSITEKKTNLATWIYSKNIERKDELDGEVFEILDTFSDFMAFKEMFLDYKAIKEGTVEDLSKDIVVSSKH